MKKHLILFCILGAIPGHFLPAQDADYNLFNQIDAMSTEKKPGPPPPNVKKDPSQPQQEPTIITATTESSFDGKTKIAVFTGEVHIKNPQFILSADKLTIYFKKDDEGAKKDPTPKPAATPKPADASKPGEHPEQGGGFDRALAEGNVVIESDRPDTNGGPPIHYIGKGEKVEYNAATGEAILRGWPQIQQGINTIVATESTTVIYLYRDGRMRIVGGQKTNINDTGPGNPLQTPAPKETPK